MLAALDPFPLSPQETVTAGKLALPPLTSPKVCHQGLQGSEEPPSLPHAWPPCILSLLCYCFCHVSPLLHISLHYMIISLPLLEGQFQGSRHTYLSVSFPAGFPTPRIATWQTLVEWTIKALVSWKLILERYHQSSRVTKPFLAAWDCKPKSLGSITSILILDLSLNYK